MATEVIKTLRASGGDYSTYNGWIAGEAGRDLVANDEIAVLEVYNDWAAGGLANSSPSDLSFSDFETDAEHPVVIRAAPGHRHNGKPFDENGNYTGANLCLSGSGTFRFTVRYLRLEGLILHHRNSTESQRHVMNTSISTAGTKPENLLIVDGCLLGNNCQHEAGSCVRSNGRRDILVLNSVAWVGGRHFHLSDNREALGWAFNCTSVNAMDFGFRQNNGPLTMINCLTAGAGNAGFIYSDATVQNCASDDDSLPTTDGNRPNQTFLFEAPGEHFYRLSTGDLGALGYGQDLSDHPQFPFSIDIMGNSRGETWDIGAFQSTPSGGDDEVDFIEADDSLSLALSITASTLPGPIEAYDTLQLGLTLQPAAQSASLQAQDSLSIDLSESPLYAVSAAVSDTSVLSLSEQAGAAPGVAAADTLALSLADQLVVSPRVAASDTLALGFAEALSTLFDVSASDALSFALSDFAQMVEAGAGRSATDTLSLDLSLSLAGASAMVAANDALQLDLDEAVERGASVTANDTLSLLLSISSAEAAPVLLLIGYLEGLLRIDAALDGSTQVDPVLDGDLEVSGS